MTNHKNISLIGILIIVAVTSAVYIPFLGNGLVFDDHNLFTSLAIYDHAQTPFDFRRRIFPYFTLGITQVLFGNIEAQRIVSLLLHVLCTLMLFRLLSAIIRHNLRRAHSIASTEEHSPEFKAAVFALIGATWFAINPVAVYGAGYLAQRTILFASLFGLLSLWFYWRALAQNRTIDIVPAALFYSFAVFSKEHAVLLFLCAIPLSLLHSPDIRANLRQTVLFILLCLPAAVAITFATQAVVGTSYEPDAADISNQIKGIPLLNQPGGAWFVSSAIQAKEFFSYLYFWWIPDVRFLSADMRIDFENLWGSPWLFLGTGAFILAPFLALYGLLKGGRVALFCCGLLFSWLLYLVELSTVRFQEPFVLYRSYLWAPGFIMMMTAAISRLPWKTALTGFAVVTPILFLLAQDRLKSFESEGTVWMDAAEKLSFPDLPGAERIFYNRGLAYLREKKYSHAITDFSKVIQIRPEIFQTYYFRGQAYYSMGQYVKANSDFKMTHQLNNTYGQAYYAQGLVFEKLECLKQAYAAYEISKELKVHVAGLKLESLKKQYPSMPQKDTARYAHCAAY